MRMTDAILPGHTSLGTIKGSANHAQPLFSFLLAGSKLRPTDTRENIVSLSPDDSKKQTEGIFILREHISTLVPLLRLEDHIPGQLFLPLKSNGPEASSWVLNSCTAIYNCLTPFCTHSIKENFVSSCH